MVDVAGPAGETGASRPTGSPGDATPAWLTPAWLTGALQRAGTLPSGEVAGVVPRSNAAFNSRVYHLELTYSPDAPRIAPRRVLLKCSLPVAWARAAGEREVRFYATLGTLPDHPPVVVPCYAAGHDPDGDSWYVLLRDLSATHRPVLTRDQQLTPGANVPSETDLARVADALARLHAYWWEHPHLGTGSDAVAAAWPAFAAAAGFDRYAERAAANWAALERAHRARLPAGTRAVLNWAVPRLGRLWQRHLAARVPVRAGVTLTHGDAYFANFLCPRRGPAPSAPGALGETVTARTYLIDWQGPAVQIGAEDLANLCATFWTPAQRAAGQREQRLLRRYHLALGAAGVRDYPWDRLLTDYRGAVITWLTVPLQDAAEGASPDYWGPKLDCLAGAFEDLGCAGLLRP